MQTREKILVGGMVVALAYAATQWLVPQRQVKTNAGHNTAGAYAEQARARAAAQLLSVQEARVLDAAVQKNLRNPFRAPAALRAPTRASPVRYTGFIRVGEHVLAVLNGREYRTEETVRGTEWVVQSIAADRVELSATDGGHTLWVMLETMDRKGDGS